MFVHNTQLRLHEREIERLQHGESSQYSKLSSGPDTPEKRMLKDQMDFRRLAWSAAARDKEAKDAVDKVRMWVNSVCVCVCVWIRA
jgi:hypothetical protein